ncbi:DUF6115 domain-containing protein [Rossellomorea vietnamensis]|uniref:Uncharacterized protein n=1 Tax=Rossellomorea vietnamensis TaxID=218284 RepID=A0A0P6W0W7_9BACI|nr:hypothetical protein [Rossellomorea vietnamensis]KPL61110.1 hypothetical protein AM506_00280 [Rossellomorea vietnamensis]
MFTFLLFISFLLNIVSLLSIVILYSRQNRFVNMEKEQKKIIVEMEDIISAYLIEMKEENDEFMRNFSTQVRNDKETVLHSEENEQEDLVPSEKVTKWTGTGYKRASQAYKQMKDHGKDPDEQSQESEQDPFIKQVLTLREKGMSIEEIAESLGKGQTEIELLLKFRQII